MSSYNGHLQYVYTGLAHITGWGSNEASKVQNSILSHMKDYSKKDS